MSGFREATTIGRSFSPLETIGRLIPRETIAGHRWKKVSSNAVSHQVEFFSNFHVSSANSFEKRTGHPLSEPNTGARACHNAVRVISVRRCLRGSGAATGYSSLYAERITPIPTPSAAPSKGLSSTFTTHASPRLSAHCNSKTARSSAAAASIGYSVS